MTKRRRNTRGFTLVEIMIVVMIIGVLLMIALPNFVQARDRTRERTCVSNLKQLTSAKVQFALEHRVASDYDVQWDDVDPYLKTRPVCPSGGDYGLLTPDNNVTCSVAGHVY